MASLIPYRFRTVSTRPMASLFNDDFFRPFFAEMDRYSGGFRVDVRDKGDHYLMEADLPGLTRDQVHVELNEGVLTIRTEVGDARNEEKDNYIYNERRCGCAQRSFTLSDIKEDEIIAEYKDGVLRLTLPKLKEPVKSARAIEIK